MIMLNYDRVTMEGIVTHFFAYDFMLHQITDSRLYMIKNKKNKCNALGLFKSNPA